MFRGQCFITLLLNAEISHLRGCTFVSFSWLASHRLRPYHTAAVAGAAAAVVELHLLGRHSRLPSRFFVYNCSVIYGRPD